MSAEAVVYSLLANAAPVTALVGTRIYPAIAPEAASASVSASLIWVA